MQQVKPVPAPGPVAPTRSPGRLVVSIVTWQAADLTIDCLRSVAPEIADLPDTRVIVVDNDSKDGAADKVERAIHDNGWSDWAEFRRAPGNNGFAAGNNVAIRQALRGDEPAEYVLLLNPDTIVRPGAFRILVRFMEEHPEVGIAGGRSENPDATPQLCCFRFPSMLSELALYLNLGIVDRLLERHLTRVGIPEEPRPIDWVSGALMIIRREVFEDVGLMDEGYFLYYEETDFTLQARRAGWPCWHIPASRVVHLVGHSLGVTERVARPKRRHKCWFESRRRYFVLNHGRLNAMVTDVFAIGGHMLWRLRRLIQRKPDSDPPCFLRDLIRHSALIHGRGSLAPRQTSL
jgi:hypothetical protein